MKAFGLVSTTALLLMLGATAPAYAQGDHGDKDAKPEKQEQAKPAQHEEKAQPAKQQEAAKPAKQEEKARPAQEEKQARTEQQMPAAKTPRQEPAKSQKQPENGQAKQANRSSAAGQQHAQRTAAEQQRQRSAPALRLSARSQSRIPDDRFRSNFGRQHSFRIGEPTLVGGYSRFQYGGYWFGFVQPWPDGWYYTDDVYVDYIDGGYYLCNPSYPGTEVALSVVL